MRVRAGRGSDRHRVSYLDAPAPTGPAYAASSSATSSFPIWSIACMARSAPAGIGYLEHLVELLWDDLPRQAEAVLEPAARAVLAAALD